MPYRTVQWRTSRDQVLIDAWFIPGSGPDAVLVSHGMGRSKQTVLAHCKLLHDNGFNVLVYDSRNHGRSGRSSRRWQLATRFTADLMDGLDQLWFQPGVRGRVAVLAFSFGTWPAVRAARREGAMIDAVICDSGPVLDIRTAVVRMAKLQSYTLPDWARRPAGRNALVLSAGTLMPLMLGEYGWPPRRPGPPVLLIAGGRDRILPAEEVTEFAAAVPGTRLWTSPRAGHLRALRSDPDGYAATVLDFLPRTRRARPQPSYQPPARQQPVRQPPGHRQSNAQPPARQSQPHQSQTRQRPYREGASRA
jgi:pimeloyl-ACP methyl ester carboxylesterase